MLDNSLLCAVWSLERVIFKSGLCSAVAFLLDVVVLMTRCFNLWWLSWFRFMCSFRVFVVLSCVKLARFKLNYVDVRSIIISATVRRTVLNTSRFHFHKWYGSTNNYYSILARFYLTLINISIWLRRLKHKAKVDFNHLTLIIIV